MFIRYYNSMDYSDDYWCVMFDMAMALGDKTGTELYNNLRTLVLGA